MARPRSTRRVKKRNVRLTPDEWAALDRLAQAKNLSTNALIRLFARHARNIGATKQEQHCPPGV